MLNKKFVSFISLMTFLLASPVQAQQTDSVSMTLDYALQIALSDNASVRVADRQIEIQKYAKKETITGLFPTVTATGTFSDAVVLQKVKLDFAPEPISMGQKYTWALNGTVALPLVAPQLWKTVSLNEEQVKLSLEAARASKVEAISQVKNAFYSLLLARESYESLLASQSTAQENATQTRNKFEQGSVSEYDKLTADVQLATINPLVSSAKNAISLAEMQLKVLMGVDVNTPIRFEGKLSDYEESLFSDLMKLKSDTALTDNTNLRQLDIQERQLRLAETINKLGYLPTLALSFQAGYQAMGKNFNPFDQSYFGGATVALSLSWTLFDGGAKYMKTRQNKLQIANLDTQRENLMRQLETSIASSLNNIETAAEQVVSNKENVYSASRAFEIARKRYDVGSGTMLELNSSESNLLTARLQYVQSIYDFLSSRATLENTLGHLVTDK